MEYLKTGILLGFERGLSRAFHKNEDKGFFSSLISRQKHANIWSGGCESPLPIQKALNKCGVRGKGCLLLLLIFKHFNVLNKFDYIFSLFQLRGLLKAH